MEERRPPALHARNVIIPVPLFRDRIPVIVDRVTTLCGPGELDRRDYN
ncbi:MAG: hypothetical protein U5L72_20335 [Bacteroidales bacterium]|nr:hypothetical protein [Bacteroidales bacterium]